MQIFVLGMHRSGTSGITRILNMAGAYFGPEGMSNGADEGNPKGFWERLDVRAACDGMLQESGYDWWRVSGFSPANIPDETRERYVAEFRKIVLELDAHRPWVVKEPRLCLLFPFVRPLLEVPVCVHVAREPLEVAHSLHTRNGFPPPAGLALWELYTMFEFRATAGLPRVLVHYEELMASPVETTTRLIHQLQELGVDGLRIPTEREITAFVSPQLHRERRSSDHRNAWMNAPQLQLAAAVDDGSVLDAEPTPREQSEGGHATLAAFEDHRAQRARVEELATQVFGLEENVTALRTDVETLGERLASRDAEAAALRSDLRTAEATLGSVERRIGSLSRARSWRLIWRVTSLRRRAAGLSAGTSPFKSILGDIEQARSSLERRDDDGSEPPQARADESSPSSAAGSSRSPSPRTSRPKVAVLAWDVGHNPLGRAHVLAGVLERRFDVEIWGAQFPRYGDQIWAPLRHSHIPIRVFEGRSFPDHLEIMERIAKRIDADAIYVSKPRLPSFGVGALAKEARNRPLVVDVDDHELAFFAETQGLDPLDLLAQGADPNVKLPFDRSWTRACEALIDAADDVTVSNVALHERYGGLIVPHARDERVFDPALHDRAETRRRLGIDASTRLLLFGGTPRIHKGIVDVLRAVDRLGDDRYRVMLFGTRELNELRDAIGPLERWVLPLPYQRFDALPALVAAADLACVLQDPDHPVSRYQLPAKITDALAMNVPCLVRPTPPLRPFIEADILHVAERGEPLDERIADIFDHYDDAIERAEKGRRFFEEQCSYDAVSEKLAPVFEGLMAGRPRPLSPRLAELNDVERRLFGPAHERARPPARVPGQRRRPIQPSEKYDVVMFWKQNDTGIYGRRQDMFVKYLARSGRVRSIVHFDKPTTPEDLYYEYRRARGATDQRRLVVRQTVARILRRRHTERTHFYTFLHAGELSRRLRLPPREGYGGFVTSVLAKHGFGQRPTILWAFPTNDDLPELIDTLDADIVVTDVIDDHRTFAEPGSSRYESFERNYREVLTRSDVVLANCEPVARAMTQFAPDVHVVPNGLELRDGTTGSPRPKELARLPGPIVGYVGNLSQRLDVPLLNALVRSHRAWQFVFVGSAHHDRSILELGSEPNVHFVGVKPYEETLRFVEHFDVALIPHLVNDMTGSMNPLKAFVYCASGVPVVSTPVANLGDLEALITVADGPAEFGAAIEAALRQGRRPPDPGTLEPHSWEMRIKQTIDIIDRTVGEVSSD